MSQIYVCILMVIAMIVAIGLSFKRNMWLWIISYWVVLTCKNAYDFVSSIM